MAATLQENSLNAQALGGSIANYANPRGPDLISRTDPLELWVNNRREVGIWPYAKAITSAPTNTVNCVDSDGAPIYGVNFASQDYLSLSGHPRIKDAAIDVIKSFGVHSAGSSALMGSTRFSLELEETIQKFTGYTSVLLYPTGWAAGYGVIQGLVRAKDHILIDSLAHACLQEAATNATTNVDRFQHLNNDQVELKLRNIRSTDAECGILVVTESLFSMDADTPDLPELQSICRRFQATLLVDAAHDLGNLGATGRGRIEDQGMMGRIDVLMGSFSKTFCSNGGFIASNSSAVRLFLNIFSNPCTFSNAMSPSQCAVVKTAFDICDSEEGHELRCKLMSKTLRLRSNLQTEGFEVFGSPGAIVPVGIGNTAQGRIVSGLLPKFGVVANLVEYPAVSKSISRLRIQIMANHSDADIDKLVAGLVSARNVAKELYDKFISDATSSPPTL